jgi:hypothetical protein
MSGKPKLSRELTNRILLIPKYLKNLIRLTHRNKIHLTVFVVRQQLHSFVLQLNADLGSTEVLIG